MRRRVGFTNKKKFPFKWFRSKANIISQQMVTGMAVGRKMYIVTFCENRYWLLCIN